MSVLCVIYNLVQTFTYHKVYTDNDYVLWSTMDWCITKFGEQQFWINPLQKIPIPYPKESIPYTPLNGKN